MAQIDSMLVSMEQDTQCKIKWDLIVRTIIKDNFARRYCRRWDYNTYANLVLLDGVIKPLKGYI
jgi:hypothetical protein